MWIASKLGFFSIVQHEKDKTLWKIRARVEQDLKNLIQAASLEGQKIISTTHTDYAHRIIIGEPEMLLVMGALFVSIDYPNFKGCLDATDQRDKHGAYIRIWGIMAGFQKRSPYNIHSHREWEHFDFAPEHLDPEPEPKKRSKKKERRLIDKFKNQKPLFE